MWFVCFAIQEEPNLETHEPAPKNTKTNRHDRIGTIKVDLILLNYHPARRSGGHPF